MSHHPHPRPRPRPHFSCASFSTPPFPCSLFFLKHTHLHLTSCINKLVPFIDRFARRQYTCNIKRDAIYDSDSNWAGAATRRPHAATHVIAVPANPDCGSPTCSTLLWLPSPPTPNPNPLDPACENQIISANSPSPRPRTSLHGMQTPPSITLNQLTLEPKACAWSELF